MVNIIQLVVIGADCILLIAAILNDRELKLFYELVYDLGMDALVEVPDGTILVSESGVSEDKDVEFLKEVGVDALLIGAVFMEAQDPKVLARKWKRK